MGNKSAKGCNERFLFSSIRKRPQEWKMLDVEEARQKYLKKGMLAEHHGLQHIELVSFLEEPDCCEVFRKLSVFEDMIETFECWMWIMNYKENPSASAGLHFIEKFMGNSNESIQKWQTVDTEDCSFSADLRNGELSPLTLEVICDHQLDCFQLLFDKVFVPFSKTAGYTRMLEMLNLSCNYVDETDFKYISILGEGAFGLVVHTQKKSTGKNYAMKIINKDDIFDSCESNLFRATQELNAYATNDHPFISRLAYAFHTDTLLIMVMPLYSGGDLKSSLSKAGSFPEARVIFYAAEIVLALTYLHEKGCVYRDLKPGNVLLDVDGHIKLSDFGTIRDLEDDDIPDEEQLALKIKPKNPFIATRSISSSISFDTLRGSFSRTPKIAAAAASSAAAVASSAGTFIRSSFSNSLMGRRSMDHASRYAADGADCVRDYSVISEVISEVEEDPTNVPSTQPRLSRRNSSLSKIKAKSIVGTLDYMAPEVLVLFGQNTESKVGYSYSVDWWSLGVTIFKMLTGHRPFSQLSIDKIENQVPTMLNRSKGIYDPKQMSSILGAINFDSRNLSRISKKAEALIVGLLDMDPLTRLGSGERGVDDIRDQSFFSGVDWDKLETNHREVVPPFVPPSTIKLAELSTCQGDAHTPPVSDASGQEISLSSVIKDCGKESWLISRDSQYACYPRLPSSFSMMNKMASGKAKMDQAKKQSIMNSWRYVNLEEVELECAAQDRRRSQWVSDN